eukprot:TRINITY_DN11888_c0_g1_i1.p1 TRINITY_DN11888_c0_g1~~TRINITY_DN11888_c0_g1_i1.p1  ORF type:complete len:250 (+),score=44.32 TRINITY_DN11888_c0_g1_i1:197-946(+)
MSSVTPLPSDLPGVAVVVGAGPGVGAAAAKRFAKGGYHVAVLARNEERLTKLAEEIEKATGGKATAIACDCADPKSVADAFGRAKSLGRIEVLVFNANSKFPWPPPRFTDITLEEFEAGLRTPSTGAFLCAQQVLAGMEEQQKGTIIFTGATASLRGGAGFSQLACGKFAIRALAQCLAREYGPKGVHVAHVILDGGVHSERMQKMRPGMAEDAMLIPEAIAESYWQLHAQHRSAWTQELDLRPFLEKF